MTTAVVLATTGCAVWRIGQSAELARLSEPYQQTPAAPVLRLLVVGDSTAVGTGASSPAHSLAGLIGREHTALLIENRARDGAKFADVLLQLEGAAGFDMVLVQAGGNDVIRLRERDALALDIDRVATAAARVAPRVLLMPCGNVGNAPFFFAPVSWWMTRRSRALHMLVAASARRSGATYINLFRERAADPFVADPGLNARDGLHPSDAGYRNWWQELKHQSGLDRELAPARGL
ncbi:MAG TPA: GDSL-type esterase/lipase family protein [Rubrivivax sp.]